MKRMKTGMFKWDIHWLLWCTAWLLFLFVSAVPAKSLGVVGSTFPVTEESLLSLIEHRVKNLDFASVQQQWIEEVSKHAERPIPLNLPRTVQTRQLTYNPSMVLGQDIADAQGRVLFPKGLRVNPLEALPSYRPCWLFFNGDDQAQVLWAKQNMQQCANPKLILTGGSVREVEEVLDAVIYFDQGGRITQKLYITHVPAKAVRNGVVMEIVEIAIRENGDAL